MDPRVTLYLMFIVLVTGIDVSLDKSRYEDGRREYELISQRSKIPRYGTCWKNAMVTIQRGCQHLTDDIQGRLALAYLNCFLQLQGLSTYECHADQPLKECIQNMLVGDRASFTTFFTHTQNICYFLEVQVWAEATENTIDRLSNISAQVASRLEDAYKLQEEIMKQASNLSKLISMSFEEIHAQFEDYKKTTKEQQMMLTDMFETITKLRQLVMGHLFWFYSILYYALSVLVCYLLTSTPRMSNARFWLFGLMTVNLMVELMIIFGNREFIQTFSSYEDEEFQALIYGLHRMCRKISFTIGVVILGVFTYCHKDQNAINNQLLMEIHRQISVLERRLPGTDTETSPMETSGDACARAEADSSSPGPESPNSPSQDMAGSVSAGKSDGNSNSDSEAKEETKSEEEALENAYKSPKEDVYSIDLKPLQNSSSYNLRSRSNT